MIPQSTDSAEAFGGGESCIRRGESNMYSVCPRNASASESASSFLLPQWTLGKGSGVPWSLGR